MKDNLNMAKMQAKKLKEKIDKAESNITTEHGHEVMKSLEKTINAESKEEIPKEIGGTLYFKSHTIAKNLNIENFASQYRNIHVLLGRDIEMEKRLIEQEKNLDLNSFEVRELDKKSREF